MVYHARCFWCDWGLTHQVDAIVEAAQQHLDECPGPVVALRPEAPQHHITFTKLAKKEAQQIE